MPTVPLLREAARARGLIDGAMLTAETAFTLVREMPLALGAPDRIAPPEVTVAAWSGDDAAKHLLLATVLEEIGAQTGLMLVTCSWEVARLAWLPAEEIAALGAAPIPDVHLFLRAQERPGDDWFALDATFPVGAASLGLPVNPRYERGEDQRIGVEIEEIVHLFDDDDIADVRARVMHEHVGAQEERRVRFQGALVAALRTL